jgi:hypothetical protein
LTTVLVFMGLILVPFVEPPTQRWVGGDVLSGDRRPSILAVLMLIAFIVVKLHEPLRIFFELELLQVTDYLFLVTVAWIWAIMLRFIWRERLFRALPGGQL